MGLIVSEKKILSFFLFFHYKSMGANDPVANILNLLALGLMVSEKKIFEVSLATRF